MISKKREMLDDLENCLDDLITDLDKEKSLSNQIDTFKNQNEVAKNIGGIGQFNNNARFSNNGVDEFNLLG
jgi:hypothetical protein